MIVVGIRLLRNRPAAVLAMTVVGLWGLMIATDHRVQATRLSQRAQRAEDTRYLSSSAYVFGPSSEGRALTVLFSYSCGFSAEFQQTLDSLREALPADVSVRMVPHMVSSVMTPDDLTFAAECAADRGLFEAFHSAVYRNVSGALAPNGWRRVAEAAGIADSSDFGHCVLSRQPADRLVDRSFIASRLGVRGTPTLFWQGVRIDGAIGLDALQSLLRNGVSTAR